MQFWPAKLNKHYTNKRKSPETDITTRTALSVGGFGRFWRSLVAVCRTTVWQHCPSLPALGKTECKVEGICYFNTPIYRNAIRCLQIFILNTKIFL